MTLTDKKVVVLGIGAVGSRLTEKLATLGVGSLRLVDDDNLSAENIQRHVLGVDSLNQNKALAMKHYLERRFPHIAITAENRCIEGTPTDVDKLFDGVDLVCITVGDETLELRLNETCKDRRPRLHAWVEPIGVGGHVLATGIEPLGCFRCLFERDGTFGLHNRSSFAAPGQRFAKSLSGCAGTFTPFSGLDADRVAIEAAELAARILIGQQRNNVLVSRFGNPEEFLSAGFRLSERAGLFKAGEVKSEVSFIDSSCQCSKWGTK